jgi:site-specific recombinase XerD
VNNEYIKKSCKTKHLNEAEKFALDKYLEIRYRSEHNLPIESKKFQNVAHIAIRNLQNQLDSGDGKEVYSHYIGCLRRYFIPFFKNKNIDLIGYKEMKEFDEFRRKKMGRVPSASTIKTHTSALNYVFDIAIQHQWILKSQIPHPKNQGRKASRRPHFTREEYRKLVRNMTEWSKTGHRKTTRDIRVLLRDYVLILAHTGMRCGRESLNLKWNQIEFFKHNGDEYLKFYVDGKTGKRELIAHNNIRTYLERIKDRFEDMKDLSLKECTNSNEYVFRTPDGRIPGNLLRSFEQLLVYCDLLHDKYGDRRTLYSIRHTYATKQLSKGVNIHLLAKQMGTSVKMIEEHYSHLVPSMSADMLSGRNHFKEEINSIKVMVK